MGTSDNADTQTFEQQVHDVVAKATVGEDGNLQLPDGVEVEESVLFAAKLEKQRRDTQSSFTKAQQENKKLLAENSKLAESWEKDAMQQLSPTEQAELDELKVQDPDAWHNKLIELKENKSTAFKEKRANISKEASQETELEKRERELAEFNEANPDFEITDEVIENDIPPRITNKLKNGDISFKEFLETCKKYVETPKKIKKDKIEPEPDISDKPGSDSPSKEARQAQSSTDYSSEIY